MNNKEAIKVLQKRLNENARYFNKFAKVTDDYYKQFVLKYRLALLYAIKALRDIDNTADVLYICDHKSCKRGITYGADACDPCGHTRNIRHAANFEPLNDNDGRILAYVERAQPDEDEGTKPQGDLISREALQEEHIKECIHNCYYCQHFKWSKKKACSYCDVIDNAPTVSKKELQWIPVSEGLPNLSDRFLVTTRYGEVMTDYFTGHHFLQGDDIIAWQKLPEPYKEGGEAND